MELLLTTGAFLLWVVLKIILTFSYAVVGGMGLCTGFRIVKKITSRKTKEYLRNLEEETANAVS